ncbi:MAG: xanthine dehydrogenase family protein molybdopterin-binding subunit [Haloarculaceae archaeon]
MTDGVYQTYGPRRTRREDRPRLTGDATYVDDIDDAQTSGEIAHAAICRSQYASADVTELDTSDAEALDGVLAVFTSDDLAASDAPGATTVAGAFDGEEVEFPLLADDRVRYTGEPIAVVVAEERALAHDAVDRIDVGYERREAVTDVRAALADDAPRVHERLESNRIFDREFGDREATAAAFEAADHTVALSLDNPRLAPSPLEPRGALADYDPASGELTVHMSTQTPHRARDGIAAFLGTPADRVRVVAPDVGGGFGSKGGAPKPGEPLAAWCSTQLGRPVKWVATRTENLRAGPHGRDSHVDAELAVDGDGSMRGLRVDVHAGAGAYPVWGQLGVAHIERLSSGAYDVPTIYGHAVGAVTNEAPIAPYRGAGRPEAIYIVERLLKRAASELDVDPAELRRRNFVPSDEFPFETAVGTVYDSGDYERALDVALDAVDYERVRERQRESGADGRYLGVGIASFVENTGTPTMAETARVEVDDAGRVTAYCGTSGHGQGHETSYAQVLADELGVPYEDVAIEEGDTADLDHGIGTFASRSAPQGVSAAVESAREVRERAREVAADHFEARTADVEFEDGTFSVAGAPERSMDLQEVATLAARSDASSADSAALEATTTYDLEGYAFTFGTHVAVVAVDPGTGEVDVRRYVAVDDCGPQFNPLIVEGQVHGAVAQGIGEAMYERATYDGQGTLVTGSFQDYALPKAGQVPDVETASTVTPSPLTATGAKGTGEGGTIAAPPAVVNAVVDALAPLGVTHVDKPLTDETVWRAIQETTPDGE